MKYLKLFENQTDYQTFIDSDEFVTPNVLFVKEEDMVVCNPFSAPNNIITYQADSKLSETFGTSYVSSLHVNAFNSPMVTHEFADGIGTITFEKDVTSIGDKAFWGCSSLTSIDIPDSVTSIDGSAFQGCDSLPVENNLRYADTYLVEAVDKTQSTYTIKEGTKWIGSNAFSNCSGLTSLVIPYSVTSIGEYAFSSCSSLPVEGNLRYADTYLVEAVDKTQSTYTIKKGTKWIGYGAFTSCTGLTSIEIPDSVTSIEGYAFNGCSSLTLVTIGSGVTSIVNEAFHGCTSLPVEGNLRYADTYLVGAVNKTQSTYTIKEGTKWIGGYAFSHCSGLYSIVIPDSVKTIGSGAFQYNDGLTEVTIGSGVTSIGDYAFRNCPSLYSIVIPDSVTSIGEQAFYGCSSLTSINIPDGVTEIGFWTFRNCSSLSSIVIPDSVTSIGEQAFLRCSGLTSVTIGSGVTSIGSRAFGDCSSLTSIVVSLGNTKYDSRENCNCIIETATNKLIKGSNNSFIPNSITSIGDGAFVDCSGLTSIVIPDSVTSIGESAFYGCSGLISVTIGSGVTSIGDYAFYGCSSLSSITCYATTAPTIDNDTFRDVKSNGVLYVPSGSDYSSWMKNSSYYLGYRNWTVQEITD